VKPTLFSGAVVIAFLANIFAASRAMPANLSTTVSLTLQIAFSVSLGVDKIGQNGDRKIHQNSSATFASRLNYL